MIQVQRPRDLTKLAGMLGLCGDDMQSWAVCKLGLNQAQIGITGAPHCFDPTGERSTFCGFSPLQVPTQVWPSEDMEKFNTGACIAFIQNIKMCRVYMFRGNQTPV